MRIDLKIDTRPNTLGENLRILLFQAIRELLVNVVKHAHATRAKILMKYVRNDLRILVQDNGSGFAPDEHQGLTKGFGLFNIRERLHHLGAEILIESSPGKGTKISLIIPTDIQGEVPNGERDGDKNHNRG